MDPYVYDFVGPEVDALTHNLTYDKKDWSVYEYDGPFDYNGGYNVWSAPAPKKAAKKAAPAAAAEEEAADAPAAFAQHKHKHHKKGVHERNMDEEVHDFVKDNVPGTEWPRSEVDPGYNGNMNMYAQHKKHHRHQARDVAERDMDEEVHGFVEDNVPGTPWGRASTPYGNNGNMNVYGQVHHKKHHKFNPFIAERKMDEEVHGFVTDAINNPLGVSRKDEAY